VADPVVGLPDLDRVVAVVIETVVDAAQTGQGDPTFTGYVGLLVGASSSNKNSVLVAYLPDGSPLGYVFSGDYRRQQLRRLGHGAVRPLPAVRALLGRSPCLVPGSRVEAR
jgi:hypothetical protein